MSVPTILRAAGWVPDGVITAEQQQQLSHYPGDTTTNRQRWRCGRVTLTLGQRTISVRVPPAVDLLRAGPRNFRAPYDLRAIERMAAEVAGAELAC